MAHPTKMTRRYFSALAAAALLTINAPAFAQEADWSFLYSYVNPDVVGGIVVEVRDNATGGCWTNLGEAKTYAEDQLRLRGYEVGDEFNYFEGWRFVIGVDAKRLPDGPCYGTLHTKLDGIGPSRGTMAYLILGELSSRFLMNENANIWVLDNIKESIDGMPER